MWPKGGWTDGWVAGWPGGKVARWPGDWVVGWKVTKHSKLVSLDYEQKLYHVFWDNANGAVTCW